jgi:hypothetical protein
MILSADEIESVIEESDDDLSNKLFAYCTNNLIKMWIILGVHLLR